MVLALMVEEMALFMVMAHNMELMAHIKEIVALIMEQSIHHHKVMEQESINHHKVIQLWFQQVVEYTLQHVVVRSFHNSMGIHSIRHLRILLKLTHQLHILIYLQLQRKSLIFFDEMQPLLRLWLYLSASIEDSFRAFHFWHWQLHMWPKEQRVLIFSF